MTARSKKRRLRYEQNLLLMTLLSGLPGTLVAFLILWFGNYTPKVIWTITTLIILFWLGYAFAVRERVIRPLQTLSNLLAALREEDYSIRATRARSGDALGEVMLEVNALGEMLREQRLGALEATALLRTVMAEIEVVVFAFDQWENRLRLVNRAGEKLLGRPGEQLLGRTADELNLNACLKGEVPRVVDFGFRGTVGRWEMHRTTFRQGGQPHTLVVLSDLSRALREEERQVWRRLIRVLGHELNNSLAPIKSIAGSLQNLIRRQPRLPDWEDDMQRGLNVIATRAEALSNFMSAYARLARLPQPQLESVDVERLVRRVSQLDHRVPIQVEAGPAATIQADEDQLEQLLINLLRNAIDASVDRKSEVTIGWAKNHRNLELWVKDSGPGLPDSENLFVPFFTTKPGGTGIGLVLSRQIAEGHGGELSVKNNAQAPGCTAVLRLPLYHNAE